jgi:hypothetical protein
VWGISYTFEDISESIKKVQFICTHQSKNALRVESLNVFEIWEQMNYTFKMLKVKDKIHARVWYLIKPLE